MKFDAEYVELRSPSWKPPTVEATLSYLNSAILPVFGHLRVSSMVRSGLAGLYHEYGRYNLEPGHGTCNDGDAAEAMSY